MSSKAPRGGPPPQRRLVLVQALTAFGDEAFAISLPLSLLAVGVNKSAPTITHGVLYLSLVCSGFLVGHRVDAHETFRFIRHGMLGAAGTVAGSVVALVAGINPLVVAVSTVACLGVSGALVASAIDAGAGRVSTPDTRRLYSSIETVRRTASMVGPTIGGIVAGFGLRLVMLLYLALFLVGIGAARGPLLHAPARPAPGPSRPWAETLAEFRRNGSLIGGVATSSAINIGTGTMVPISLVRLRTEFHSPASAIGLMMAIVGCVTIGVAQLAGRTRRGNIVGAALCCAFTAALIPFASSAALLVAALCVGSGAGVFFNVRWRSFRQSVTAPQRLGGVSAWCRSLAYIWVAAASFLASGLMALGTGPARAQLVLGLASVLIVSLVASSRLRPAMPVG